MTLVSFIDSRILSNSVDASAVNLRRPSLRGSTSERVIVAVAVPESEDLHAGGFRALEVHVVADAPKVDPPHTWRLFDGPAHEFMPLSELCDERFEVDIEGMGSLVAILQPPLTSFENMPRGEGGEFDRGDDSPRLAKGSQECTRVDELSSTRVGLPFADQTEFFVGRHNRFGPFANPHGHARALLQIGLTIQHDPAIHHAG